MIHGRGRRINQQQTSRYLQPREHLQPNKKASLRWLSFDAKESRRGAYLLAALAGAEAAGAEAAAGAAAEAGAEAAGAEAAAGAAAEAGAEAAGAASSFLPQAARARAAIMEANRRDFFICFLKASDRSNGRLKSVDSENGKAHEPSCHKGHVKFNCKYSAYSGFPR
jgi:hypothetical protein